MAGELNGARVIVIGGGVIGASVAYHLAALGDEVLLLERDQVTSGTTWHAAGLMVTFGSLSHTSTRMRQYTRDLYARLEAETGQSTGFKPVGFIEVAATTDRLTEYRRIAAFNRYLGVDVHEITAREVAELFPLARTDDVLAGFYVPDDGRANPVDVTMALVKGARARGARIIEGTAVSSVLVEHPGTARARVRGVRTAEGDLDCEVVINCAGMWARQLGEINDVALPLQAAEHYYLITEPMDGVHPGLPVLEDPSTYGYIREETGGLMVGLFEGAAAPWSVPGVPQDFSFGTLPPDWDRIEPYLQAAMSRVPATLTAGIRTLFCGPESFTPDLAPLFGEVPEIGNYFVAAGLNSIGILTGGGIGRAMAQWVHSGEPDIDITGMDVARTQPFQATPDFRRDRTAEALGLVYATHYPNQQPRTARGAKRSVLHDRLAEAGAVFGDVSGWESPLAFAADAGPLTFGRPAWFEQWAIEHQAVRQNVGLFDLSFMATFLVQGPDAAALLDRLSTANVAGAVGQCRYTQWLNASGGIIADVTVARLGVEEFWVTASDTAQRRVGAILHRALSSQTRATVTDVSSSRALLAVQGPRSRDLLISVGAEVADLEPYRARRVDIGYARFWCLRIGYTGELGYELYPAAEQAIGVFDRLIKVGADSGLRLAGLAALGSLRLEKGYRDFGHDIDNLDTLAEAGLGFTVDLTDTHGETRDFTGADAVRAQSIAGPPTARLVQVLLTDPEPLLFHGAVVHRDGVPVGEVRSASYGHTLGAAVGLAMVTNPRGPADATWLTDGNWTVDLADQQAAATVSLRPRYDPRSLRQRS